MGLCSLIRVRLFQGWERDRTLGSPDHSVHNASVTSCYDAGVFEGLARSERCLFTVFHKAPVQCRTTDTP